MKISRLIINNYRNIENLDIKLENPTVFIGDNNSGKSNILKAVTLPFLSNDIGYNGKNLSWSDINNETKKSYYKYIFDNQEKIIDNTINLEEFTTALPKILVEVILQPESTEHYFVRNLAFDIDGNNDIRYGICYEFFPKNVKDVVTRIQEVFKLQESDNLDLEDLNSFKMNLLPIDLYSHSIRVPKKKSSISYDDLKLFKYTSLVAERDDFSRSADKIGSKSLLKLLQMKLTTNSKMIVEKEYNTFFNTLKKVSAMDNIINWQEKSDIENAKDFFEKISIMPNMPNMNSLLSSVKLGYADDNLSSQGLGHRNLILILVLLNSFIEKNEETALSVVTLEEPEAHLGIGNKRLISSYMNSFTEMTSSVQLLYSTHSTDFINKLDFNSIVLVNNGSALSLSTDLSTEGKNYLSKNPNLDLYNLFFSKKCILVEGLSEELFIRSYIDSQHSLSDIVVISFHKGFTNIIDIWLKLNKNSTNRLGIVRDFDNQPTAKINHEVYNNNNNVHVETTQAYTLEPEIVSTSNNYDVLKAYFNDNFNWEVNSKEELSTKWMNAKADVMLHICKDISNGNLSDLELPKHIKSVIDFLSPVKEKSTVRKEKLK
ncbi:ATP-dependent nuclease [Leuconostoc suionicum]|uniref:ATP-dependent nuclease n=1 Tax=Leuconostoc suionicum TaxID=1511761 RepID=UPI0024AD9976|nr:AAA family ATPase [Leuconostoc suionicum]MDI6502432.1 AAA family ATPase [Leuconostoc suionicum]